MQWIDAATVHATLDYPALCQALAREHEHAAPVTGDMTLQPATGADRFMLRAAWSEKRLMGVKLASVFPGNPEQHPPLPSIQGVYMAFDARTGSPLFVADGAALTARKTAADSALGMHLLAAPDVNTLLMIGAGAMARPLIEAFMALRPSLNRILLWNRTAHRAQALCAALRAADIDTHVVNDLDAALPLADVICSATASETPLIKGEHLKPGAHVNLVGGWQAHQREADDQTLARALLHVDFRPTALASGDLAIGLANGTIDESSIRGDLFELCQGTARTEPGAITLFKNAGGPHLDLFTAGFLASRLGLVSR